MHTILTLRFLLDHCFLKLLNFGRRVQETKFVFVFFFFIEIIIIITMMHLIGIRHCCCCFCQSYLFVVAVVFATIISCWLRLAAVVGVVVQVLLATFIISVDKGASTHAVTIGAADILFRALLYQFLGRFGYLYAIFFQVNYSDILTLLLSPPS